jgi:hypothetical protein
VQCLHLCRIAILSVDFLAIALLKLIPSKL